MKLIKILIAVLLFYFLALVQTSFLVHFHPLNINLILILVIIWNIFEKPKDSSGLFIAAIGGFFLDVFSSGTMGFNLLFLIVISFFIKLIFKRYVQIPFIERV